MNDRMDPMFRMLMEPFRPKDPAPSYLCGAPNCPTHPSKHAMCPDAGLCPHGMVLADDVCGPCSEGRPNRKGAY